MGHVLVDWEDAGRISPSVAMAADGEDATIEQGRNIYIFPLEDSLTETGMQEVETYITCCKNTAAQFIATSPIMNLRLEAVRRP